MSSPLPPLCRSPFESELPSPGSLWCPVVALAPAVAPDLPLLPPLAGALLPDELAFELAFVTLLSCVELSLDELWLVLEVAAALLEELLDELELIDWPPPVRVWSLPEPACVVGLVSCVELVLAPLAPLLLPSWPSPLPSPPPEPPISWSW